MSSSSSSTSSSKRNGKKGSSAASSHKDAELLDEAEQQRQMDEIRATVNRQTSQARRVFHAVLLVVAVLLSTCFIYNMLFPFEMEHQQHFRDKVPHLAFQLYYLAATLCLVFAALVAKRGMAGLPLAARLVGCTLAALLCLAWAGVFWLHPPPWATHWTLLWLPLAAPAAIALGLYVDRDAHTLLEDVERLEALRYPHKSI